MCCGTLRNSVTVLAETPKCSRTAGLLLMPKGTSGIRPATRRNWAAASPCGSCGAQREEGGERRAEQREARPGPAPPQPAQGRPLPAARGAPAPPFRGPARPGPCPPPAPPCCGAGEPGGSWRGDVGWGGRRAQRQRTCACVCAIQVVKILHF